MRFQNIVISGDIGTGTSTLAKNLSSELGWECLSVGSFFRQYALEHHLPLWDKASVPVEVEKEIDYLFQDKMKKEVNKLFEGHYSGWFAKDLPKSFRILLNADLEVCLERAVKRLDHTHLETREEVFKRREGIIEKFKTVYGEDDYLNPAYFNLMIDTTNITPEEVLKRVLLEIKSK
jgi:cytidylate kinase